MDEIDDFPDINADLVADFLDAVLDTERIILGGRVRFCGMYCLVFVVEEYDVGKRTANVNA